MQLTNLKEYIEYNAEKFTKRVIFKEGGSTVFVLNFSAAQQLPAHKHPGTNVYIVVLEGEGSFIIDGKETKARKDDVLFLTGEEELVFKNGQVNTSLYVMLNKIPDEKYAQNLG